MKLFTSRLAFFGVFLLSAATLAAPAYAIVIDTGAGLDTANGVVIEDKRPSLPSYSRVAGLFSLSDPQTITSVSGWISMYSTGSLQFSIAADTAGLPSSILYSASIALPTPVVKDHANWYGPSGLQWNVAPGNYWLIVSEPTPSFADAAMPFGSIPHPLAGYAFDSDGSPGFARDDSRALGMRIETSPVPEPATTSLWIVGLACLLRASGSRSRVSSPSSSNFTLEMQRQSPKSSA